MPPESSTASSATRPAASVSSRWAAVSASRNADADYKLKIKNAERAYSYICICTMPIEGGYYGVDKLEGEHNEDGDSEDEEMSDDDDDDDDDEEGSSKCDGGKTCICSKPAAENPLHPWVFSNAGFLKYTTQQTLESLRDPDNFSMYTWNDHHSHGAMEVVQNLFLDFVEADADWREQWAVVEGMVLYLLSGAASLMAMSDSGEDVILTTRLAGRIFLAMLARLERQGMLKEVSDVKNLGLIMSLWVKCAAQMREVDSLDEREESADLRSSEGSFVFNPARFDDYVVAYANKFAIPLKGLRDIDDLAADCDGTVDLPVATEADPDPWGLAGALRKYERSCGKTNRPGKKGAIGGDSLDITTWSTAERKSHSFDGKDPLGRKEKEAIKKGMVMQLA